MVAFRKMKKHVFSNKLIRSVPKDIFHRERLFDRLDSARGRPGIWVTGFPGCGKTTLISSYVNARELPCLWYQADEGDSDPETFFHFMGLAIEDAGIDAQTSLPVFAPEHSKALSVFALRYFEALFQQLKVPGIIVFDDYQEVPDHSPFHEIMRIVLSKIPEGITVILISRNAPPPALVRECLNHEMETLGWDSLRLTSWETGEVVRVRTREELPEETIDELHQTIDGWVAGLILMILNAKMENSDIQHIGKYVPENIFDYFRNETFDKTDVETQDFLLRTALLPGISVEMAEKLTDHPRTPSILSELHRNNHFTEKFFLPEPVYCYHPLFRKFLFLRANETFSKNQLLGLCRQAADFFEEIDRPEVAFSLLHKAGDTYAKVKLILAHASDMLAQGRHFLLKKWLKAIPKDIIEQTPWLLCWMGDCYLLSDPDLSRQCFEKAFEQFRIQGSKGETLWAWSGIVNAIAYGCENFTGLDHWIRIIEELTDDGQVPSDKVEARVAARMFGALVLRQPDHPDIQAWAERAALFSGDCKSSGTDYMQMLFHMALFRIFTGDFTKAESTVNAMRQMTRSENATPLISILSGYAAAMYHQFTGMSEQCMSVVSETLDLAQTSGMHIMDCGLISQSVSSALNMNDLGTAEKHLEDIRSCLTSCKRWDLSQYHFLKARTALIRKDIDQAAFHADLSLNMGAAMGFVFPMAFCHLIKAHVMHELGKHRKAKHHLEHVFRISQQTKSDLLAFYGLWTKAWIALEKGNQVSGLKFFRKALAIGKHQGYLNTFIDQPAVTLKLCIKALETGIEVPYVQEIIRKRGLTSYEKSFYVKNWPWSLKVFTLGRFSLVKEGKPVRFSGKARQKPLKMLKVLIALGGREIKEDRIADVLWPEADGDVAHRNFKTTLHRLRNLLGNSDAVELQDGRLTLNSRHCWVDIWAFQRAFGQADTAWKKASEGRDAANAVELARKAVDFYKGPFLAEETGASWVLSLREHLRSKFLRGMTWLGDHWEKSEQWERAAECYQRGLEVDHLSEDFYRRLMICYHHLGLQSEALMVYERCKQMLSATLGLDPSDHTEIIRNFVFSEKR